ncbi:sterol esterase [Sarracenia purpurea var. burkii]
MALRSLFNGSFVLSLWAVFFLFVADPSQALGLTRGSFGFSGGATITLPSPTGMCTAVVAIHGYKCQEFEMKTDDGYILSLQRIPEGRVGGGANIK